LIPEIFPKGGGPEFFSLEEGNKIFQNFKGGTNLLGHYGLYYFFVLVYTVATKNIENVLKYQFYLFFHNRKQPVSFSA